MPVDKTLKTVWLEITGGRNVCFNALHVDVTTQAIASPLLRLPADRLVYAFNADRLVRAAGGTLYPVSAFPMSRDDWRRHFGPAWERLHDARRNV